MRESQPFPLVACRVQGMQIIKCPTSGGAVLPDYICSYMTSYLNIEEYHQLASQQHTRSTTQRSLSPHSTNKPAITQDIAEAP